jgi:uncharacterized protein YndB with AHSA1/START domain
MTNLPEYVIDQTFNAPRATVWRAWTEAEPLAEWYGPGVETVIHALDVRAGGHWRNEMRWGENSMFSQMSYTEVVEGEKLVWLHESTDADWTAAPNPMMPEWPVTLLTTVTFKDHEGGTKVRLSQILHNATEAQCASFAATMAGMDKGWGSGFKILEKVLGVLA